MLPALLACARAMHTKPSWDPRPGAARSEWLREDAEKLGKARKGPALMKSHGPPRRYVGAQTKATRPRDSSSWDDGDWRKFPSHAVGSNANEAELPRLILHLERVPELFDCGNVDPGLKRRLQGDLDRIATLLGRLDHNPITQRCIHLTCSKAEKTQE
eukprot:scaffold1384_cov256-Pinguiococcus_pyrenoidosus.AAC.18